MVEVEKRGQLNSEEHSTTIANKLLELGAKSSNLSRSEGIYIIGDNFTVKIMKFNNESCKVSYKPKTADHAAEEIDFQIAPEEYDNSVKFFKNLLDTSDCYDIEQSRTDYSLDDFTISLKWSPDWKHHIEIEKLVEKPEEIPSAIQQIDSMAETLQINLLSEEEEKAFIAKLVKARQSV